MQARSSCCMQTTHRTMWKTLVYPGPPIPEATHIKDFVSFFHGRRARNARSQHRSFADLGLVLQVLGQGQSVGALLVNAQGEGLHAPLQQEASMRVQAAPQVVQPGYQLHRQATAGEYPLTQANAQFYVQYMMTIRGTAMRAQPLRCCVYLQVLVGNTKQAGDWNCPDTIMLVSRSHSDSLAA